MASNGNRRHRAAIGQLPLCRQAAFFIGRRRQQLPALSYSHEHLSRGAGSRRAEVMTDFFLKMSRRGAPVRVSAIAVSVLGVIRYRCMVLPQLFYRYRTEAGMLPFFVGLKARQTFAVAFADPRHLPRRS